eukprot:GHVQ01034134.1.p1 GENE.GHVQ01034134.1~~GHVQ01034134.1.p1  ORF type:complete len:598 (-),score=105.77 GHVQ01034134.1:1953-3746(-)
MAVVGVEQESGSLGHGKDEGDIKDDESLRISSDDEESNFVSNNSSDKEVFSSAHLSSASMKEEDKKLKEEIKKLSDEDRVAESEKFKALGTAEFKGKNYQTAIRQYVQALKYIVFDAKNRSMKPDDSTASDSVEVKSRELQISCELNICMCHIKLGEWFSAIRCSDFVLEMSPNNIKAMYRRGLSRSNFGQLQEGRQDLLKVIELDPENMEARQELVNIKDKVKLQKLSDKKAYGNIFGGGGLYEDKEKERQLKLQREEERRAQRREEWHKEMNKRQEEGQEEISFEAWGTEKDAKAKKEEEAAEAERKAKQKASEPNPTVSGGTSKLDEDGLDEEDQRILNETKKMGYCYFRRDLTEDERRLNSMNKPQRLQSASGSATVSNEASNPLSPVSTALSSWNAKGTTYEEKDTTAWCQERFSTKLKNVEVGSKPNFDDHSTFSDLLKDLPLNNNSQDPMAALAKLTEKMYTLSMKTESVKEVGGEGHISVISGSRRFLFDLHATVVWTLTIDTNLPESFAPPSASPHPPPQTYRGELVINDVSSALPANCTWLSDSRIVYYDKNIKPEHKHIVASLMEDYKKMVIKQIDEFLEDYRNSS